MGRPVYVELAFNLARSFFHWNRDRSISFHLVTDLPLILPSDLKEVVVNPVVAGRFGAGFSPKLWLDELAPAYQTLFVDSDCLCFGSLAPVFDRFAGKTVSVIGETRSTGEFFGDIPTLCRNLKLPWIPVFVGAIYYLENSPAAKAVFAQARSFERDYDALGLVRLRGVPNDEPLIALGMARHGLLPVPDDGGIKADAMHYLKFAEMDVLNGHIRVEKPVPGKSVPSTASPVLFHFNSHYTLERHYRRESCRLKKVCAQHWPSGLAAIYSTLRHDLPALLTQGLKNLLRPLSHRIFGYRRIAKQERET